MTDRDEILNLMATYCHLYDEGSLEEWAELFRHGSYTFLSKTFNGTEEILKWVVPTSVRGGTRHVNFNHSVVVEGDRAHSRSDYATVARDVPGSLKFDNPETVWGRYEDEFQKIDGRWCFKARVAHVDDEAAVNRVWDFMRKNAAVFLARSDELYE